MGSENLIGYGVAGIASLLSH